MVQLDALLKLLDGPRDNAALRFAIATELLRLGEPGQAETHLRQALAWQADYTAAWKLLGKALVAAERVHEALTAYRHGIEVAQAHGDIQAAREMAVFVRRLEG
jgi:Flp pilus assembly protein TadD